MILNKGMKIRTAFDGEIYKVVGFWRDDYVFAPTGEEEQCMIYTPAEVEELLGKGEFEAI